MSVFMDKYFWWLPMGSVPEVSARDLQSEITKTRGSLQILDVRTSGEYAQGASKGALLMPISTLKNRIEALPYDRSKPVVAICRSAHRSIPAVRLLRAAGYSDVRQLQGGMLSWQALNYPLTRP